MKTFVTDFDGTLTAYDFFDLVRERWPAPPGEDPWDQYVAGRLTHFEALAQIFRRIRTTEASLLELAGTMQLDPHVAATERSLTAHGWSVVVASAGCDWYIRRLLRQAGATMEVHANPGEFRDGEGLLVPPVRRFARGWLAGELRRRHEVYRPFNHWSEITPQLIAC